MDDEVQGVLEEGAAEEDGGLLLDAPVSDELALVDEDVPLLEDGPAWDVARPDEEPPMLEGAAIRELAAAKVLVAMVEEDVWPLELCALTSRGEHPPCWQDCSRVQSASASHGNRAVVHAAANIETATTRRQPDMAVPSREG